MIGLAFASVLTWTVWLAKTLELAAAKRRARRALERARQARARSPRPSRRRRRDGGAGRRLRARGDRRTAAVGRRARHATASRSASPRGWSGSRRRAGRRMLARHRRARHHRRDRALRRPVRHGLGHHEQLHRHLEGADHQPRGGGARHRRGAAGDRARPRRRDSGGRDLQHVRALGSPATARCSATRRRRSCASSAATSTVARRPVERRRCATPRSDADERRASTTASDELDEVHEINVTPFIDVMLVLLIIFMVAAPLATVDVAGRPAGLDRASRSRGPTSRCSSPSSAT